MTTPTDTPADAVADPAGEAGVLAAADALVAAFGQGRVEDYFDRFAADATFVFHTTGERLDSRAAYRELWRRWETEDGFRVLACTSSGQLVQLLGTTAVFSHDVRTTVATHAGEETVEERETIVFARAEVPGGWLAVHEHLSPRPAPAV
ncbi:nuclear transport factor 2 family protein [Streptomyces sp. NPDC050400]|uniref:nuclear transport factor 2 family protein n=1 Tax=Streptomyces sp. NPDC050400 TaxID=3365610 RepID=UPI0037AC4D4B